MGMFDRVWVPCPRCGNLVEFQSKGGDCILADYSLDNAPIDVLGDIVADTWECRRCHTPVRVKVQFFAHAYTPLNEGEIPNLRDW